MDSHTGLRILHKSTRWLLAVLIVAVGGLTTVAFLIMGILDKRNSSQQHFEQQASDISGAIQRSWQAYEIFGLWAHESCHKLASSVQPNSNNLEDVLHMCSREEFRNLFEQILSVGLGLFSLQYAPRVEHRYRQALEEESRVFLGDNFPYINYTGIQSFETTADGGRRAIRSPDKPFYFPVHHVEPMMGNEPIYEMDTYSASFAVINQAIEHWKPVLSSPYKLYQDENSDRFSVFLVHPGTNSSVYGEAPHAVVAAVVQIPDLLAWAAQGTDHHHEEAVYLYDSTDGTMQFLGGMETRTCASCQSGTSVTSVQETAFEDIPRSRRSQFFQTSINVVDRQWTIAVIPIDQSRWSDYTFVILGGALIFVLFFLLALLFKWYLDRINVINEIKSKAEAEKVDNALHQANRERRLNEYLAHEVRNPLASAMAALAFVSEHTLELVDTESTRKLILDDAHIVDSSLNYINDLLRSMLDINRAANGKLKTNIHPTDILRDILEPAAAALSVRNASVEVLIDCPAGLVVSADQLRLKQIIMNLSINSTKFVETGFIRLRASVVDGTVLLFVEDSGPGVPIDKRTRLFASFQESLDLLNQGIGLSICQKLCNLMGATIWLDECYDSGLLGSPGARFVVDLQQSPCTDMISRMNSFCEAMHESTSDQPEQKNESSTFSTELSGLDNPTEDSPTGTTESQQKLPESLRVLFVDDETILRRLFMRTIHKVAPTWHVSEATNGSQALQLVEEQDFDVIFMDQYMPCEKPILGTEVVRIWRSKGVSSRICGVSANDMKQDFLDAGADGFILKPFPCKKDALQAELVKLCGSRRPKDICVEV